MQAVLMLYCDWGPSWQAIEALTKQRLDWQVSPLEQSLELLQPLPLPHFVGQLPPQSTSVSAPLRNESEHEGSCSQGRLKSITPK